MKELQRSELLDLLWQWEQAFTRHRRRQSDNLTSLQQMAEERQYQEAQAAFRRDMDTYVGCSFSSKADVADVDEKSLWVVLGGARKRYLMPAYSNEVEFDDYSLKLLYPENEGHRVASLRKGDPVVVEGKVVVIDLQMMTLMLTNVTRRSGCFAFGLLGV